jgi:hypothetical protein
VRYQDLMRVLRQEHGIVGACCVTREVHPPHTICISIKKRKALDAIQHDGSREEGEPETVMLHRPKPTAERNPE